MDYIVVCEQWQPKFYVSDIIGRQYEKIVMNMSNLARNVKSLVILITYHLRAYRELFRRGRFQIEVWTF